MLLIKNANYFDSYNKSFIKSDILIKNDKIVDIKTSIEMNNVEIIDAQNKYIVPPFFDLHCHLREPGFEYKEDIISGSKSAINGGYGYVCCMPNTNPIIDNKALVGYINYRSKLVEPFKIYPIGSITKSQQGEELSEIGSMVEEGIVAISDDGKSVVNTAVMKNALMYAKQFNIPVISHCEDHFLTYQGQINEGEISTILGLKGIPREAETIIALRDIQLAKESGGHIHITHVSVKETVEAIRAAKEKGINVTADTCPHYLTLTEDEVIGYNTLAKINPPLRTKEDVEALIEACQDGTIDCITTDHAPHHMDEKNVEFDKAAFGTIGFDTAFAALNTYVIKTNKLKLEKVIELLSINPAKIINKSISQISINQKASLIILDLEKEWHVNTQTILSKSKNSVFLNKLLKGFIEYVILEGKIMKKEGKMVETLF